jgi:hypothetical protein
MSAPCPLPGETPATQVTRDNEGLTEHSVPGYLSATDAVAA